MSLLGIQACAKHLIHMKKITAVQKRKEKMKASSKKQKLSAKIRLSQVGLQITDVVKKDIFTLAEEDDEGITTAIIIIIIIIIITIIIMIIRK